MRYWKMWRMVELSWYRKYMVARMQGAPDNLVLMNWVQGCSENYQYILAN